MAEGSRKGICAVCWDRAQKLIVKVEVDVLGSQSLIARTVSVDCKATLNIKHPQSSEADCESRSGRPGFPVPNSPYGLCGRKATIEECWHEVLVAERQQRTGDESRAVWTDRSEVSRQTSGFNVQSTTSVCLRQDDGVGYPVTQ